MTDAFRNQALAERHLLAMGVAHFDLALMDAKSGALTIEDDRILQQIKESMDWLWEENHKGRHIMVRPHGEHGMTLVDGLTHKQVSAMIINGLEPAVVVQVDAQFYQAWLKHDRKLEMQESEVMARQLSELVGVSAETSQWDKFGYLAGFELHQGGKQSDFQIQLIEDGGQVFSRAEEMAAQLSRP
jgi:hypothetical protein